MPDWGDPNRDRLQAFRQTQAQGSKKPAPAWSTLARPSPQHTPSQQVTFVGYNYVNASDSRQFSALAGDSPPTIVGGNVAKINVIDRPQRRGLTQFVGYDPPSMQVMLRFMQFDTQHGWLTSDKAGIAVETDITALEWMGGHGLNTGAPPIVYASTYDLAGNTTGLIPFEWQTANTNNVPQQFRNDFLRPWFVQTLAWDQNPLRNSSGLRIKQDVTVTLVEYEDIPGSGSPSAALRNQQPGKPGKTLSFRATSAYDTPIRIAGAPQVHAVDRQAVAWAIVRDPQNRALKLRSPTSKIKPGTVVRVPPLPQASSAPVPVSSSTQTQSSH